MPLVEIDQSGRRWAAVPLRRWGFRRVRIAMVRSRSFRLRGRSVLAARLNTTNIIVQPKLRRSLRKHVRKRQSVENFTTILPLAANGQTAKASLRFTLTVERRFRSQLMVVMLGKSVRFIANVLQQSQRVGTLA